MPNNPNAIAPSAGAANVSRRTAHHLIGRFQGPELFFVQPFAALSFPIIPRNLNLSRPLESIEIMWRGRVVIGTANIAPIAPEAPQTIIQRIRLTGTHRLFNQMAPIDISGPTAFAWCRLFQVRGNSINILNGGVNTRLADQGVPIGNAGTVFGNTGTYDMELHYRIPLGLMFPPNSRVSVIPQMYFAQDWADSLQIQLFFGDGTSFGTLGTSTVTFSAYGSGAGSPSVTIACNYGLLGPLANSFNGAVVVRNEQFLTGPVQGGIVNATQLMLLAKQNTANLIVKTGTLLTGTSGGVQIFGTLVDTLLDRTQMQVDNKPLRNNQSNAMAKEYFGNMFNTILPAGYQGWTFVESMQPKTALRGKDIPGGATFSLISDVLTNNANQMISVVQEQVFGNGSAKPVTA